MVSADSYGIDYTGATDVRVALAAAINAQSSGTTFTLHPGGSYLLTYNTPLVLTAAGVTVDGLGATLFRNQRRTQITGSPTEDIVHISASNMTLRNLRIFGFRKDTYNGNVLTTVVGSPTVVGTTVQLDAQNEEVRCPKVGLDINSSDNTLPPNGVSNSPHPHTNFETPYYFRQIDGLLKFEAVLSDTTHVVSDAVFSIIDDETDALIYSQAFTLTSTPTTKTITFDPGTTYIGRPMRVTVKKAMAAANTITVTSITPYGEIGYRDKDASDPYGIFTGGNEFSDAIQVNTPISNTTLEYLDIEGPDGDGINCAAVDTNTIIRHCNVRGCGRQAYTIHQSINPLIEDCTAREVGRSGVDYEPNTVISIMSGGTVQRCTFENIRNYTMSAAHWAKLLDFTISDITSIRSGMGAFRGGGRNLTITDYVHGETYRTDADRVANGGHTGADTDFMGINMEVTNFTTQFGFWLTAITNNYNDGSGVVAYSPDDIHVHNAIVTAPYTDPYVFIDATNSTVDLGATGTNAFQTGGGLFVDAMPVMYAPEATTAGPLTITVPGPSAVEEAFQQDTFQDDAFQQAAATDGITHSPSLFAPVSIGETVTEAQFVYLTGTGGWDSDFVVWDDPNHTWDEPNVGGLVLGSPQVFTPSVNESVLPDLISVVPELYTPTVAPKAVVAPLINVPVNLFPLTVNQYVFQADTIDASPVVFEFQFAGPITPDLIDHTPEVFTPTVNPAEVVVPLISQVPALFDIRVQLSVAPGLIDHTPVVYDPRVGPFIDPIDIIDIQPVVYTPSLERIFVDLIDVSPEVFEPQRVNIPINSVIRLDDDPNGLADMSPELYEPSSVDIAPAKFVVMALIDAVPFIYTHRIVTPTRGIIVLHARYDPVTVKHARYDPVTLKHAQNTRQGA